MAVFRVYAVSGKNRIIACLLLLVMFAHLVLCAVLTADPNNAGELYSTVIPARIYAADYV